MKRSDSAKQHPSRFGDATRGSVEERLGMEFFTGSVRTNVALPSADPGPILESTAQSWHHYFFRTEHSLFCVFR